MKMVVAIVQGKDAGMLLDKLVEQKFGVTRINTSGGFLRESNVTLLIGVDDWRVDAVLTTIRAVCRTRSRYISPLPGGIDPALSTQGQAALPVEIQVGGATVFVLNVERYLRL